LAFPWLVVALVGCVGTADGPGQHEGNPGAVSVDPSSVYLGVVAWGQTATREVFLSNDSDEAAYVTALVPSSDAVVVDPAGALTIAPGGFVVLTIEWTPATIDDLDARIEVMGADGPYTAVSVTGGTSYPVLSALIDGFDFGAVGLRCERVLPLLVTNEGNADLVMSWAPEVTDSEFALRAAWGQSLETPLSIAPGTSQTIEVVYSPTMLHAAEATLEVTTNDPFAPIVELDVHGEGFSTEQQTTEWTVGPEAQVILFQVNGLVYGASPWSERLHDFLPAFFDDLLAANVPFRVAFIAGWGGQVDGGIPYVDDSFTSADAVEAVQGMLTPTSADVDDGLETCLVALEANADWVLDDADPWPRSKLNLIVVNPDAEQSFRDATYYIEHYEAFKGSSNVAVHGIAGDVPKGCSGGLKGAANPSENLYDATVASGGVFLSICEKDWTATAAALASACMTFTGFHFGEDPAPPSIHVYVDGAEVLTGWSYDATADALVFDDASYPPAGAELRADYVLAEICE
jgi:hypothetical protein